jgi:uncharacterized protein involved in exopolysaccharide biosynthesis
MEKKTTEQKIQDFIQKLRPYLMKLWSNRKKLIIINSAVMVIALLYVLFIVKPYYESSVVILPEYGSKSNMLSQLSGLAALAGVKVGEVAPTEIYQNLLQSESVMGPVIYGKYLTKEYPDSVNLIQYFKIQGDDPNPEIQKRKRFLALDENLTKIFISTDIDRMTKILSIKVTMPEAQLSADVVNKLVESLDSYIRTKRKSYAIEQRFYLEKRVGQIKDSLTICENMLRDFRERNRMVIQSPNLLLEQERLMRNIQIQQNVFIELTKQYELAKIDEIKDAPVLNIKETALSPVKKAGPKRLNMLIMIFFASILCSITYYLFIDNMKRIWNSLKATEKR